MAAKKKNKGKGKPPAGAQPVTQPPFVHIHCSSRFDRSAASLESDLDHWMADSSLVTLTEISSNMRAATMREKGWGYFNAKKSDGQDECGIAWKLDTWHQTHHVTCRLNNDAYYRLDGRPADPVVSSTVNLKRVDTGHRLMVSVTHMPAHVEGFGGWRTTEYKWQARKNAYLSSLKNWGVHIADLERKHSPDMVMVVADWNLNLKQDWVRDLIRNNFGENFKQAWKRFPTSGGSLSGGPIAPLGAPGVDYADRIIDGTIFHGGKAWFEPNLLARVNSSDHRPYKEGFEFQHAAGHPGAEAGDSATDQGGNNDAEGNTYHGEAWWGFGDYMVDEIYTVGAVTGASGGEVL